jgi:hypothetical protein
LRFASYFAQKLTSAQMASFCGVSQRQLVCLLEQSFVVESIVDNSLP